MATIERDQLVTLVYGGQKSLKGLDLSGLDLSNLDLAGVDFTGAKLIRTNFSKANLKGANFSGVNAAHARFRGADVSGALFADTHLSKASFIDAKADGAKMVGCDLHDAIVSKSTAAGVTNWTGSWFPNRASAGVADIPGKPMSRPQKGRDIDETPVVSNPNFGLARSASRRPFAHFGSKF